MKNSGFGLNESYVEILRSQWLESPLSVSEEWQQYFSGQSEDMGKEEAPFAIKPEDLSKAPAVPVPKVVPQMADVKEKGAAELLLGIDRAIAQNMEESLTVPTASSLRDIPVKVMEENRAIINQFLEDDARPRCSFTHIVAYAIVQALKHYPQLNARFEMTPKGPARTLEKHMNLGVAIDLPGRDGRRTLVVPNIKKAEQLDFLQFFQAYNNLIALAREGKLNTSHFLGTTVTLTNPGGLGTVSSSPRLMKGQSAIFATGRIGYPAEYEATSPETLQLLGVGKVMNVTSTYDHRIIQGAESGQYLALLHKLLIGEHNFYNDIFQCLRIPHLPYRLRADEAVVLGQHADVTQMERAMRVSQLIHAYRVRGFLLAHVDPLYLIAREHPELDLKTYGLTIWDLDRTFHTLGLLPEKTAVFRTILSRLRNTYCRRMGVEYMYINDVERKTWLQRRVERDNSVFSVDEKKRILKKLVQAEGFEHFLHKRYVGHKRFSIEGAEATIPALSELLDCAAADGATDVLIGMAHRGRLNVLANIVGKPYEAIFAEFDDIDPKSIQGTGDVKYHLGAKGIHRYKGMVKDGTRPEEREVRVELACNPSHLEAVNPIVEGLVRAKQDLAGDRQRDKIIPVLLHGDAAFASQGVVYETLEFSGLSGYRTGGTVHIIINNQIGYTTPPEKARTSLNCSDLGRAIGIPIFRVNGDDPEACLRAIRIAFEYRAKFFSDVIIDLVCYRRHGHNEGDEPSFTQPILYRAIKDHLSVATLYADFLVRKGDITEEEVNAIKQTFYTVFENALQAVREKGRDAVAEGHALYDEPLTLENVEYPQTQVDADILKMIAERTTFTPHKIEIHPRVYEQVLMRRKAMVFEQGHGIDFGMAEILAYGSLLLEVIPVRMSGQDCGRGTFAHRHAVLYDVNDGRPYIPLNHLRRSRDEGEEIWHPSRFRIYDSPLSEEAVVGFEYGYSVGHPTSLVIWEAQFGDFFNGAQVQIDQFIASSEAKWGQRSRLVLFLPHGYDGQGPEHSSARIERFLQLCAEDNMRVANCTTSAQLFHLLRRQAKQPKKPLIVFTHKSLLRAEEASSPLEALSSGSFMRVIDDPRVLMKPAAKFERLIFVSGKVYWDLERHRRAHEEKDLPEVSIVRLEEIYPFPFAQIEAILHTRKAKEIVWLQEEPKNNGAYMFVKEYFAQAGVSIRYIGRAASASPATGSPKAHKRQQLALVLAAFQKFDKKSQDLEVGL